MATLFWICLGLVLFSLAGYPVVLAFWEALREIAAGARYVTGTGERRVRRQRDAWPSVTIVVAAYDEESCIGQKIENCLSLDYPADKLEVLVGCDGCDDRTAEMARSSQDARVFVHELTPRSGKASVLSRLVPMARGDLVVLTDANVHFEREALQALVRRFQDPAVGAVVGRLRLYNRVKRNYEESAYWRYETFLKFVEGKHGCVVGANGGIYAIRRLLFGPLSPKTIVDDFVIPARIAARGWKVPYEPEAVAWEETTEDYRQEFGRRARIGAGNWQSLALVPELLDPRTGFLFFAFVAHKLLRWATPFLLALALAANAALAIRSLPYAVLLVGQAAFYLLALVGWSGVAWRGQRIASMVYYFVSMNLALAVGFFRFLFRTQRAAWQRTERVPGPGPKPDIRAA
jgi:cellulose synthase/poly-beta-1,6-N-acetylglucosamine synthase-like glycosyltransferase